MKIALTALSVAVIASAFAPARPAQAVPCATPDGSVTAACNDCLHAEAQAKHDPATIALKCGYPGTVASPNQVDPPGQSP